MPDAQPLDPTDPLRLGAYRVTGRIGAGGQGVVYLGEAEDGSAVAIKLFHTRFGEDRAFRDGFTRELEVAKQVARFCTAQVLDSGMLGGRPYIVSEYVPGRSLHQVVNAEGPRTGSALDRLAIGTATALVALHDAGIVHRDFKPQNVLLGPDGPRVIDFGIARALAGASTVASQIVGTPAYMSPEQLSGHELGLTVDVFSWASTVAFAATGRPPFGGDSIPAIMNRILHSPPDLDGIESPLRDLLAECLSKDPAERPSAQRLLDRLVRRNEHAAATSPVQPTAGPTATSTEKADVPRDIGTVTTDGSASKITTSASPTSPASPADTVPPRRRRGLLLAAVAVVAAVGAGATVVVPNAEAFGLWPGTPSGGPTGFAAVPTEDAPAASPSPTGTGEQVLSRDPESSRRPSASARPSGEPAKPTPTVRATTPKPTAKPTPEPTPKPTPARLTELGPGNFTRYCRSLGWAWVEYREKPRPGAYCVRRNGDTMYLTQAKRDAGCQLRYAEPKAFHRFKGKSNYCYLVRP